MAHPRFRRVLHLLAAAVAGCGPGGADSARSPGPGEEGSPSPLAARCAPDAGGILLPEGFCALVAAEGVGPARHLAVAANGDVFVALDAGEGGRPGAAGVLALRDTDGDGVLDARERWEDGGVGGVRVEGSSLYVTTGEAVLRYVLADGSLVPSGPPDTVVAGLPAPAGRGPGGIALGPAGDLYVGLGAASNACQGPDPSPGDPGLDPCPELAERAGIWRFAADGAGQTPADADRFATGLRDVPALATDPATGALYGVQLGRDRLHEAFPELYGLEEGRDKPAEELVRIEEGDDFGWPYCYYDPEQRVKVLAPEYGGEGRTVGRCGETKPPLLGLPAHWAPTDLTFYAGTQFPGRYRGGAFLAFQGPDGGAALPGRAPGVVFVPFVDGRPAAAWETFADGFGGDEVGGPPGRRPAGLALAPDGSLYVADGVEGRLWRVVYRGG